MILSVWLCRPMDKKAPTVQEFLSKIKDCLIVVIADRFCQTARSVKHHALSLGNRLSATSNVCNAPGLRGLKIDSI